MGPTDTRAIFSIHPLVANRATNFEASLYDLICDIGEHAVRCAVTWDDEMGYFHIEEFRYWCYLTWRDE
jgi:hypothetical protein